MSENFELVGVLY